MADTYPCPDRLPPIAEHCLSKQWLAAEIYPAIAIAAARVKAFQTLMEIPESLQLPDFIVPPDDYPAVDCIFTSVGHPPVNPAVPLPGEFYGLGSYVKLMFDTGYVVKQVKYSDESLWTLPPATKAEVEMLQACGAFWGSWDDVYTCMSMDSTIRDQAFAAGCGGGCMQYKTWNEFYQLVHCASDYTCYPNCDCIYCDSISCMPCGNCITIQVVYDGYCAVESVSGSGGTDSCVEDFVMTDAMMFDDYGEAVNNLSVSVSVHLVKGYVIWETTVSDGRVGDPYTPVVSSHKPEMRITGSDAPGEPCAELDGTGTLVDSESVTVFSYDDTVDPPVTTPTGDIIISMHSGYPICATPWCGVRKHYVLDMGTIPECEACGASIAPETDGKLVRTVGGLELESTPASHLGREFYAEVVFDDILCTYRLKISCSSLGVTVWEGLRLSGCGGPNGSYTTDPDFDATHGGSAPCFTATVVLNHYVP